MKSLVAVVSFAVMLLLAVACGGDGGQTNLTNKPGRDDGPAWSPDGSRIAFVSFLRLGRLDPDPNTDIYVMNADGSGLTHLTNSPTGGGSPAWSPDGTQIAFSGIYVMNADGTGLTRLTNSPQDEGGPTWQP